MPPIPAVVGWTLTVTFFVLTSVIFRAASLDAAWRIYEGLAAVPAFGSSQHRDAVLFGLVAGLAMPASHRICQWLTDHARQATAVALGAITAIAMIAMTGRGNYEFVYFQF
jgi:hypothetical protein